MKVVQAYFPFQEKGGPVIKVRSIALGLAARGHFVTVLTANYGFPSSLAAKFSAEKCKWGWRAEEKGVATVYLRSWGHYRALTFNPAVVSFASGSVTDFDLTHIYGLYDLLGPVIGFFCRKREVPYVIEPMGMYRPIVRNLRMKRMYHRLLGNSLVRGANRLIATSEQEREEMIAGGIEPARIGVRRNGVQAPESFPAPGTFRRQWLIAPKAKVILYLGRLITKKNPDLLLEAFARWRREASDGEDSVLVLAGPEEGNGYGIHLRSLAASAGIARSVLFTGPLYDDAKWAAYRDADVFVLPSQNENFGNSAAEAMACGTPVIVTDRCGIAPLVRQNAGLVVHHDSAAVANALELLLKDAGLAARLRARSAETAGSLSWDEPLSQMEALYHAAVGVTASA